jgi:hypothetical protein
VASVGADDHPGVLGDRPAVLVVAADAGHVPVGHDHVLDGEPSRTSAPASAAASTSSRSSTVRRGPWATGVSSVPGAPESANGPKSNR